MKRKAFTMYEMAIVLVIIGIIMGMLVKGSSMIRTAELRREIWKVEKVRAALSVFERQTSRCPGNICNVWVTGSYKEAIGDLVDAGLISDSDFISNFDSKTTRWALFPCKSHDTPSAGYVDGGPNLCVAMYRGTIDVHPTPAVRNEATPYSVLGGYELYFDDNNSSAGIGRLRNKPQITSREEFRDFLKRTDNITVTEYDVKVWP
jgi:prepilin-type N-terminal cleavage/methylation domain-containing protein